MLCTCGVCSLALECGLGEQERLEEKLEDAGRSARLEIDHEGTIDGLRHELRTCQERLTEARCIAYHAR